MATSLDVQLGLAQRCLHTARWLHDQLFNRGLPAVLLLAWAAHGLRRATPPPQAASTHNATRALLLARGLVPLLAMVAIGVASGAALQMHWGTPARQQLGGPVRVLSGDAAMAGALALRLPEHPLVLIDGRPDFSPWVPPELVARCGLLQLGPLVSLPGGQPLGPPFTGLGWRVLPPQPVVAACPPLSPD